MFPLLSNSDLLLHGLGYAIAYAIPVAIIFAASYYLLDVVTPGHKIGDRMREGSHSAGLVSAGWMAGQALILWSAVWHNGDSNLGWSLVNTLAFSLVGALLLAGTFLIVDVLTPGRLGDEVCAPGPIVPLAVFTAASLVGIGLVIAACIA